MSAVAVDPAWLQRLQARIAVPPLNPRVPLALAIAGAPPRVVGSVESTLALGLAGAGFALVDTGSAWQLDLPNAAAADPTLAQIARWLRANDLASAWRDELLDVTDADDRVCAVIERAAVRPLGIATRAVHLVVGDGHGGAWLQQRALDKAVDPGLWDTTMGGLVSAGESTRDSLARETWEEAGLRLDQMTPVLALGRFTVRRPLPEGYMVEHIDMFDAIALEGVVPANQDGEVAAFECVQRDELRARLQADAFTLEAAMILARWLEQRP